MDDATPIFVWTMGKVGTSTVSRGLARAGIPALHMHSVRPEVHATVTAKRGGNVPPHVKASLKAIDLMTNGSGLIRIISMVRDPVARNISAFFENLHVFGVSQNDSVADLIQAFNDRYSHDTPLQWFDHELKSCIGFDVFKQSFDRDSKFGRYGHGRYDLLIIRSDADLAVQEREVSKFAGTLVKLVVENAAEKKVYNKVYRNFRETLSLSTNYIERMYRSTLARHFWTDAELAEMSSKHLRTSVNLAR